jgi:hypothetical protein
MYEGRLPLPTKMSLTVFQGSATKENLIWAFGTTKPAAAADSTLQQHLDSGAFSLDLTQPMSASGSTTPTASGSVKVPLLPYQKTIIAHAVIATFGFLFLLPAGVLLARFIRTISPKWFKGHWIIQAAVGENARLLPVMDIL